jgi:hypothetical protein
LNPGSLAFRSILNCPPRQLEELLRLSLVTCPVALYPATSDSEKISFNQINRMTGQRIKYAKVDADTGEEVSSEDIMKGYKVDTDTYIEVSKIVWHHTGARTTRTALHYVRRRIQPDSTVSSKTSKAASSWRPSNTSHHIACWHKCEAPMGSELVCLLGRPLRHCRVSFRPYRRVDFNRCLGDLFQSGKNHDEGNGEKQHGKADRAR